ncbi:MAG: hypothetical protein RLZZ342_524 [Candidatus Parcubacteria bacterium]|jgi:O-antigen/teichoic acid export membrane protein
MRERLQARIVALLRWSEKYTKTDMVYLASGGFWLVLEQAAGMALSFALAIAFGHFASKDMYGNYKYILSLAGLLSAVSLSGLGDAMNQSVARGYDGALTQSLRLQARWSLPFVLVTLGTAAYYSWIADNEFVAGSLVIVALLQPVLASVSIFASFFYAQKDFVRGSLYSIGMNTITFLALLAALFLGERAIMLVGTYFVVKTLAAAYGFWKAYRHRRNDTEDPALFGFSAHLSAMNVIGAIADKIDSVIIFTLLGPAQLATYAFALAIPEQIKGVAKNLYGLALPRFAAREVSDIQQTIWRKLFLVLGSTAIVVLIYIGAAPALFVFLFPIYTDAITYSQWYALSILPASIVPILAAALTAHQKTRALYISTNGSSIVLIMALLILIPWFGLAGAIAAQVIYRLCNMILTIWQFTKA